MIVSERKPLEEVVSFLQGQDRLFLVVCQGCPEGCESGSPAEVAQLTEELQANGKQVVGTASIDFLCNKLLVARRLAVHLDALNQADAALVVSCGIGVQAVANTMDLTCHPALNTLSMGSFQGLWPSSERCEECGNCVLQYTAGICPRTACSKSLLNGACGGTMDDGTCEVTREMECGWLRIYKRLEQLGRLEHMGAFVEPADHLKLRGEDRHRRTPWWSIEYPEPEPEPASKEK